MRTSEALAFTFRARSMKFHALLRSSAVSPPHPPSPGIAQIQYKERHSMSRSGNIPTAGINAPVFSSKFGTSAMGGVDVLVEVCERHTVRPCANTSCTHTTLPSVARASQAWGIDEAVRGTWKLYFSSETYAISTTQAATYSCLALSHNVRLQNVNRWTAALHMINVYRGCRKRPSRAKKVAPYLHIFSYSYMVLPSTFCSKTFTIPAVHTSIPTLFRSCPRDCRDADCDRAP